MFRIIYDIDNIAGSILNLNSRAALTFSFCYLYDYGICARVFFLLFLIYKFNITAAELGVCKPCIITDEKMHIRQTVSTRAQINLSCKLISRKNILRDEKYRTEKFVNLLLILRDSCRNYSHTSKTDILRA